MVLRRQLDKDPQFQVALELVQDKGMYNRIITPTDAKVKQATPEGPVCHFVCLRSCHRFLRTILDCRCGIDYLGQSSD